MKAKIIPIRPLKLGPTQFKAEVERLKREGRMPSLSELLDAVPEARKKSVPRVRRSARRSSHDRRL